MQTTLLALAAAVSATSAAHAAAPPAARSHFTETGYVLSIDKSAAQSLIGPEQELAPQDLTDSAHNPVVIRHFQYPDMTAVPPTGAPFGYDELAIYIPNARLKAGYTCAGIVPGTAAFMPTLYLNQQLPVTLGVQLYGFNKSLENVTATETSFEVHAAKDGANLYGAVFGLEQPLTAQGLARFQKIFIEFPMALMGRKLNADGTTTMTWSGIQVDLSQAKFSSVNVVHDHFRGIPELDRALAGQSFAHRGLNYEPLGGYRIRNAAFELSQPVPCERAAQ